MFNSIFKKQLVLYMGVLAVSFLLTSVALTQAFRMYFTTQKEKALMAQGEKISQMFPRALRPGFFNEIYVNQIVNQLNIIYEYLDASFIIVSIADSEFVVVTVSEDIDPAYKNTAVNLPQLVPVMEGKQVTAQGRLGDFYRHPVLSVAYPIQMGADTIGAVIMNTSLPELQQTIGEAYRLILLGLLLSIIITYVFIYFSSKAISRPIMEINRAAKVIANGEFEKRIAVQSSDEIGQLAESFNDMAADLNEQENIRREFIANISHDFRSPLTSIRGFLTAINDGVVPGDKVGHYLEIVLEETERLTKLANDILDINAADYSKTVLTKETFDLNDLIRKTAGNFETRIMSKKINIRAVLEDNIWVVADYEKIRRIIHNLMDNAVKFTPENGEILIETTLKNKKVYVNISDTGKGIDENEKKRLFDRFYKSDVSRGEDKAGSGLGLSIVREFIRAHNEEVFIGNRPAGGCEVIFTLTPVLGITQLNELTE